MSKDRDRLMEIVGEISELLHEFKTIVRGKFTPSEFELFKYRTLAHIEPGLSEESNWVAGPGVDSLEKVAEDFPDDEEDDEEEEEEDEKETPNG